jgi:hypothetical protein
MGDPISAAIKFMIELRKMSVYPEACDKHVVDEWEYIGNPGKIEVTRCICDTPIENLFLIENILNGNRAIIGCECIKRWNIECEVSCDTCKKKFPRNVGIRRACTGNLICRKCKARQKKIEKEEESWREQRIRKFAKWTMFAPGIWKDLPFHSIVENENWIKDLLIMNLEYKKDDSIKKSLAAFHTYCSHLGYSLEDEEEGPPC